MSFKIVVCPGCKQLGEVQDLPCAADERLLEALGVAWPPPGGWRLRSAWCPHCEMPFLMVWPGGLSPDERRELAGYRPDAQEHLAEEERP